MLTKVKLKIGKNILRRFWRQRPGRFVAVLLLGLGLVLGLHFLFLDLFRFLNSLGGLGTLIIRHLLYIIFSILFFMVSLSCGILFFSFAYCNRETLFLLALPVGVVRVGLSRLLESGLCAVWVPFIGTILFLLSFHRVVGISMVYACVSIVFLVPFFIMTASFGASCAILAMRFLNKRRFLIMAGVCISVGLWFVMGSGSAKASLDSFDISRLFGFLQFSKQWYLPFFWISEGLVKLQQQNWRQAFLFWMNLASFAALALYVFAVLCQRFFTESFLQRLSFRAQAYYDEYLLRGLWPWKIIPVYLRNLLAKDIKSLSRDIAWRMQFFIFFGILFFYFVNIRNISWFSYQSMTPVWKEFISALNMFAVLCIVASLMVRFIYPQWNSEGLNIWQLKLSCVSFRTIAFEKVILGTVFFLPVTLGLILISGTMLGLVLSELFIHMIVAGIACMTLLCLAVGLGAYFFDPVDSDVIRTVETWGSFLTLALGLCYVVLAVGGFFGLRYFYVTGALTNAFIPAIIAYMSGYSLLSGMIMLIVIKIGLVRLKQKEL